MADKKAAAKRAKSKYEREKVRHKQLKFYPKDSGSLAWLEAQPSQNAYLLGLIEKDMDGTGASIDPVAEYLVPVARSRMPMKTMVSARRIRDILSLRLEAIERDRRTVHVAGQ